VRGVTYWLAVTTSPRPPGHPAGAPGGQGGTGGQGGIGGQCGDNTGNTGGLGATVVNPFALKNNTISSIPVKRR
jgi:hypothetical protein